MNFPALGSSLLDQVDVLCTLGLTLGGGKSAEKQHSSLFR
jgi:hypothetical protein